MHTCTRAYSYTRKPASGYIWMHAIYCVSQPVIIFRQAKEHPYPGISHKFARCEELGFFWFLLFCFFLQNSVSGAWSEDEKMALTHTLFTCRILASGWVRTTGITSDSCTHVNARHRLIYASVPSISSSRHFLLHICFHNSLRFLRIYFLFKVFLSSRFFP